MNFQSRTLELIPTRVSVAVRMSRIRKLIPFIPNLANLSLMDSPPCESQVLVRNGDNQSPRQNNDGSTIDIQKMSWRYIPVSLSRRTSQAPRPPRLLFMLADSNRPLSPNLLWSLNTHKLADPNNAHQPLFRDGMLT